jgi:phosphoribosyl 1,2-cyclic phosphodiesterase
VAVLRRLLDHWNGLFRFRRFVTAQLTVNSTFGRNRTTGWTLRLFGLTGLRVVSLVS